MKYQKHYLSDKISNRMCPIQRDYQCDSFCAWFDHEHQDCRLLGMMWKIRDDLHDITDAIDGISNVIREGKNAKREFKF